MNDFIKDIIIVIGIGYFFQAGAILFRMTLDLLCFILEKIIEKMEGKKCQH
jgi:hypothetical protein